LRILMALPLSRGSRSTPKGDRKQGIAEKSTGAMGVLEFASLKENRIYQKEDRF